MAVSFKYGAEAVALVGIAYGLIRWVGRTLRSLVSGTAYEESRLQALGSGVPGVVEDSLVRQGLVSPDALAAMSPREREFLRVNASSRQRAIASDGARAERISLTPSRGSGTVRGTPASGTRVQEPSPRLHLITPSRPPLGLAVHCPGCGGALDRDALQRFGTTTCSRCKRPVSAHLQRGRVTVIVEETVEEAEHRRRVEGTP